MGKDLKDLETSPTTSSALTFTTIQRNTYKRLRIANLIDNPCVDVVFFIFMYSLILHYVRSKTQGFVKQRCYIQITGRKRKLMFFSVCMTRNSYQMIVKVRQMEEFRIDFSFYPLTLTRWPLSGRKTLPVREKRKTSGFEGYVANVASLD